jgi:hypothetical protein
MKKILLTFLSILVITNFAACGNNSETNLIKPDESKTSSFIDSFDDQNGDTERVRLTFSGGEAILALENNAAAQSLVELLPLTQEFEDFNGIEKICRLSDAISTDGVAKGIDPDVADVALYIPWNTLVFYYEDYGYNDNLIPIGHIESGMEQLTAMGERFTVKLERIDETNKNESGTVTDGIQSEATNITLTSGNTVITAALDNSETTKAFLATLPRTLSMTNYANREYYARIDALPENGEAISDYENGDVTYYPAGPSFAVFFGKADTSNQSGLIRMGKITSDLAAFSAFDDNVEFLIEIAE